MYNLTPLAFKYGKYQLHNRIALCNNNFTNLSKCKNYVGIHICKKEPRDNCTIPLLLKQKAHCNIIQENNSPLQILDNGNILIDNEHTWNGIRVNGPHLIQFNSNTTIDNKTYINHKQEIKNVIHAYQNERVNVLRILNSESDYKFTNIQEMYKLFLPIEEHPWKFTLYLIMIIIILALVTYLIIKLYTCRQIQLNTRRQREFELAYLTELQRLQTLSR